MKRLLALLILTLTGETAMALEEPDYEVLLTAGDIEIRHYDSYLFAEVTVEGEAQDRRAFRILAGYIFGDNAQGEKMQMTAPVETQGDAYAFVMERKYSLDNLPRPNDARIRLLRREARVVAALRFSGRWSDANFEKHEKEIVERLESMGIRMIGAPTLARYNSPFTPWFMRRNEILVPVDRESIRPEEIIATRLPARL